MTVIPFKKPEPIDPHIGGEAFCIACSATWAAVAPVGTVSLQCPECQAMKGRFKFECAPAEGTEIRVCNCGNDLFYLTRDGHMCANCGTYQSY